LSYHFERAKIKSKFQFASDRLEWGTTKKEEGCIDSFLDHFSEGVVRINKKK